jgi:hypothetical protein
MQFPNPYNNNGRGTTPIIGQEQVPVVNFSIQVTKELMEALQTFAADTGLDGLSLMNHVFTRGLTAIKSDLYHAQEDNRIKEDQGPTEE